MKRKKPPSVGSSDIRAFFSSGNSSCKSYAPNGNGGVSTRRASKTATEGPTAGHRRAITRAKSATLINDDRITSGTSVPSVNAGKCSPEPLALATRTSRKRRVAPGSALPTVASVPDTKESTEVVALVSKPARGSNKENGVCASPRNDPPPAPHQQMARKTLSDFYLVPCPRGGAGDSRVSDSGGYQLPLGEVVVGRDSVRDSNKNNRNKLRIGIPNSEEGISRDQATLRVCSREKRVLVMNKKAALNPIRIERWSGSADINSERSSRDVSSSKDITLVLTAGQEGYLYPGDSLGLDGFRQRSRAKFRYVLRSLPPGAQETTAILAGVPPRTEVAAGVGKRDPSAPVMDSAVEPLAPKVPETKSSALNIVSTSPLANATSVPPPGDLPTALASISSCEKAPVSGGGTDNLAASPSVRKMASSGADRTARDHDETTDLGLKTSEAVGQDDWASNRKKLRTDSTEARSSAPVCGESPVLPSARSSSSKTTVGGPDVPSENGAGPASTTPGVEKDRVGTPSKKLRFGMMTAIVPPEAPRDLTGVATSAVPGCRDSAGARSGAQESTTCEKAKLGNIETIVDRAVEIEHDDEPFPVARGREIGNEDAERVDGAAPSIPVDVPSPKAVIKQADTQAPESPSLQTERLAIDVLLPQAVPPVAADETGQETLAASTSIVVPNPLPSTAVAPNNDRLDLRPPNQIASSAALDNVSSVRTLFPESVSESNLENTMRGDDVSADETEPYDSAINVEAGRLGRTPGEDSTVTIPSDMGSGNETMGSGVAVEGRAEPARLTVGVTQEASPRHETIRPDPSLEGPTELPTATADSSPINTGATDASLTPRKPDSGSAGEEEARAARTSAAGVDPRRGRAPRWREGDLVVLRARFGKGENKLGGVARVLSGFEDGTYTVKLVLGSSRPQRVAAELLSSCDQDKDGVQPSSRRRNFLPPSVPTTAPATCVGSTTRRNGRGKVKGANDADFDAEKSSAPVAEVASVAEFQDSPELSGRVRVLYDTTDWYLGTVIAVHRGASVTVRFDDGSEERVKLCPGDAELCADDAIVPPSAAENVGKAKSDRGDETANGTRKVRSSWYGRAHGGQTARNRDLRTSPPVSGALERVDKVDHGLVLTEGRARALLDTVPEKLVGLTFQEFHRGYGGWWNTTVMHVSREKVGDEVGDAEDINPDWPESVMAEQADPTGASPGCFRVKRKVDLLLSCLRAWDKQRELLAKEAAKQEMRGARKSAQTGRKCSHAPSKEPSITAQSAPAATGGKRRSATANTGTGAERTQEAKAAASSEKQTTSAMTSTDVGGGRATCSPASSTSSATHPTGRKSEHRQRRQEESRQEDKKTPSCGGHAGPASKSLESSTPALTTAEEGASGVDPGRVNSVRQAVRDVPDASAPEVQVSSKQQEDNRRISCNYGGKIFHGKDPSSSIDSHVLRCSRNVATTTGSTTVGVTKGSGTLSITSLGSVDPTRIVGSQILTETPTPIPGGISSMLAIATSGDDLATVVAAIEELSARGMCPNQKLCDRAIQEILRSRCRLRTECLRRLLAESQATYPDCWQPLNWDRFEECLQRIAGERDMSALRAHAVAVGLVLDCVERHRRKYEATGAGSPLAPLFAGSGSDGNGREALKKCARWAAETWARRSGHVAGRDVASGQRNSEARACRIMARALCEAAEGFIAAGSCSEGSARSMGMEACRLIAVEVEAHCGELSRPGSGDATSTNCGNSGMESAARSRAGLLTALAGRTFRPRLAGMLLENMPEGSGCVEVEELRSLLSLAQGERLPTSAGGGCFKGKRDKGMSGSRILYADLDLQA